MEEQHWRDGAHRGRGAWPNWAKGLASAVIGFHLLTMLAVALAAAPASPLERDFARNFAPYIELFNLGHAHRYYAPAPPPTPVVTAELRFGEGQPTRTVRLPDRSVAPRISYQRQLALAFHLNGEFQMAQGDPRGPRPSLWGASYARHLCATNPGCTGVVLRVQQHLVPDLVRLRQMSEGPGARPPDLEDERFFTVPELIGDYPCDGR